MPDATYVGAGMPCGNCGNPLTPGQPHKCGRVGNPYAPSSDWKPGQDTFTAQAAGIWDEGFAAGRAAATPDPPDESHAVKCAEARGYARGRFERDPAASPDPPDLPALDEGPLAYLLEDSAASPDERLREALAFYADKGNYTAQNPVGSGAHVWRDMGGRARSALAAADRPQPPADERLREAAQVAVFACLPVLHIVGSQNRGYRVSDVIDPKVIADPQEWVDAAHAICELHHVLAAADRDTACTDRENTGPGGAVTRGIVPRGTDALAPRGPAGSDGEDR